MRDISSGLSLVRRAWSVRACGVAFIWLTSLGLPACSPRPADCSRIDVVCAGLVTEFGSTEEGIQQEAWLALRDAKAAGLVDRIDRIETKDPRDHTANIDTFGEDQYDIIVTVGASLSDDTTAAAEKYPALHFIGVEQEQATTIANLVGLVFHEERSGFLAGALAGLLTQSGRVVAICESSFVDSMRRYCQGFRAGAQYANPSAHVDISYHEGSADSLFRAVEWGKTEALQQVGQGADIVFAAGHDTAAAALRAAAGQGALVIGTETDLYASMVDIRGELLTSATNDVRSGVLDLVRLGREGRWPKGEYFGQVQLAPFHETDGRIPVQIEDQLLGINRGLEDGTIHLDIQHERP